MRLAADENLEKSIVDWLRQAGHDVFYGAEETAGDDDDIFLSRVTAQNRIVITNDLDLGELVRKKARACAGLVLIRCTLQSSAARLQWFVLRWPQIQNELEGNFIILSRTRTRIRSLD